ncbi:MAG: response regulator transcription factor [Chthonomonadales bacterium]
MKILVVDDEQPILEAVAYTLRKEGYTALTAANAEQCMEIARNEKPNLIILDVMLPSASGFDICRMIRKQSSVPIIMLTARAEETDRVVGLELGADDYVTKPFSMRELLARVKTILRRTNNGDAHATKQVVEAASIRIDPAKHEVTVAGKKAALSPKEFDLLHFLVTHPDQVFTRQTLLDQVWGADAYVEDRTVDVHIRWLREKVENEPSQPLRLITVRGVGYKLSTEA